MHLLDVAREASIPLLPTAITSIKDRRKTEMNRSESILIISMLVVMTLATGYIFTSLANEAHHHEHLLEMDQQQAQQMSIQEQLEHRQDVEIDNAARDMRRPRDNFDIDEADEEEQQSPPQAANVEMDEIQYEQQVPLQEQHSEHELEKYGMAVQSQELEHPLTAANEQSQELKYPSEANEQSPPSTAALVHMEKVETDNSPAKLPFDLGEKMREWLVKKQLENGLFYIPQGMEEGKKMKQYSTREIANTIPHFTRDLFLVMYSSATDEFTVLQTNESNAGVNIKNIMQAILYAFRNRYFHRFGNGSQDLAFLVSTGDFPQLSEDCLNMPGICKRRSGFAPILHFGSTFSDTLDHFGAFTDGATFTDEMILPSVVTMPPPPRVHLRCMAEWQVYHEVCEFLQPKRITMDGRVENESGILFGENIIDGGSVRGRGLVWEDLIPQVVWRGANHPYLPLLNPELRMPNYPTDVEPMIQEYGHGVEGFLRAINDVYNFLRPQWKAAMITVQAEVNAFNANKNPKRKQKVLPFANMKLLRSSLAFHKATGFDKQSQYYKEWNAIGMAATGDDLPPEELARYKYHIDIGGRGGTSYSVQWWSSTIEKLAFPGLLFHHETGAEDWYFEHLVPWVHYVPVKEDLSDLQEQFEWAEKHEKKARDIAKAGTEFVRRMGRPEGLDEISRRHFLKPLENIIEAFQPIDGTPLDTNGFQQIMRCSGNNIDDCQLL